jgi:hypothetical protein
MRFVAFAPAARSRRVETLLFVAFATAIASCDGCDDSDGNDPCTTVYQNECGQPCALDTNCAAGLYCGPEGKCLADCTPDGGQCPEGVTCSDKGRCGGDSTGTFGSGGGFNTGGGTSTACPGISVTFQPQTPSVLLLVDQSGSMTESFGGGNRWDVLYDVLMDPGDGVVTQMQSVVRFSFSLYTGDEQQCPKLAQVTPPALNNRDAIDAVYGPAGPDGETPTGDSITALVPTLVGFGEPGPKAIVLATDGEPDTCEEPNPQNGQAEAIAAAQSAFSQGVQLFIIAVGDDVSDQHQQEMANAGIGLPVDGSQGNATYYPANDTSALQEAFETIINGIRPCTLTLDGMIDVTKACEGTIFLDGVPLECNGPNGWQANSPTEIELLGEACEAIQEGTHTISGDFPCGVVTTPQ